MVGCFFPLSFVNHLLINTRNSSFAKQQFMIAPQPLCLSLTGLQHLHGRTRRLISEDLGGRGLEGHRGSLDWTPEAGVMRKPRFYLLIWHCSSSGNTLLRRRAISCLFYTPPHTHTFLPPLLLPSLPACYYPKPADLIS